MPDHTIDAAIARGDAAAKRLIEARDALFPHLGVILLIAGADGLRASAAGAVEAVIIAHQRMRGATVIPFDGGDAAQGPNAPLFEEAE